MICTDWGKSRKAVLVRVAVVRSEAYPSSTTVISSRMYGVSSMRVIAMAGTCCATDTGRSTVL